MHQSFLLRISKAEQKSNIDDISNTSDIGASLLAVTYHRTVVEDMLLQQFSHCDTASPEGTFAVHNTPLRG